MAKPKPDPLRDRLDELAAARLAQLPDGSLLEAFFDFVEQLFLMPDDELRQYLLLGRLHQDDRKAWNRLSRRVLEAVATGTIEVSDVRGPADLARVAEIVSKVARNTKIPKPVQPDVMRQMQVVIARLHAVKWRARFGHGAQAPVNGSVALVLLQDARDRDVVELLADLVQREVKRLRTTRTMCPSDQEETGNLALGRFTAKPPDFLAVNAPSNTVESFRLVVRTIQRAVRKAAEELRPTRGPSARTQREHRRRGGAPPPIDGMRRSDVAKMLDVDPKTLARMEGKLVHPTKGRNVVYSHTDVRVVEAELEARKARRRG